MAYLDASFCATAVFPERGSPMKDIFKGMYRGRLVFWGSIVLGYALSMINYRAFDSCISFSEWPFSFQSP